ncbi:hypothetical protein J1614_008420 [Plenodomus biglobosus]|nr:hypothetical protein J1614_008420 [Plenodomus biglobosus]
MWLWRSKRARPAPAWEGKKGSFWDTLAVDAFVHRHRQRPDPLFHHLFLGQAALQTSAQAVAHGASACESPYSKHIETASTSAVHPTKPWRPNKAPSQSSRLPRHSQKPNGHKSAKTIKTSSSTWFASSLIAPLGDHRRAHIPPSKGKKRKRTTNPDPKGPSSPPPPPLHDAPPPPPAISKHILVGLNAITRHLELAAARNAPATLAAPAAPCTTTTPDSKTNLNSNANNLAIIILTHPKPSSSPAHAHIPTLLHISTLSPHPAAPAPLASNTQPRLVPLATSADPRLAVKLGIPRVGALAIMDGAPGAKALVEYVREHVDLTECAWVDEALAPRWKGAKVTMEMSGAAGKR